MGDQWSRPTPPELNRIRHDMGVSARVFETRGGLHFTERETPITVLDSSLLYTVRVPVRDLHQHIGTWVSVQTSLRVAFTPFAQPDALLIAYSVICQGDATEMISTTLGRKELRAFVAAHLFPRLRHISAS